MPRRKPIVPLKEKRDLGSTEFAEVRARFCSAKTTELSEERRGEKMICATELMEKTDKKLPYPTRALKVNGAVVEEYIIPKEKKAEVLAELYLFTPVPALDEEFIDLHEGRKFKVLDFRVTREDGQNFLVSPYYPKSGGTVIDWIPVD